jgi:hypothetical protein
MGAQDRAAARMTIDELVAESCEAQGVPEHVDDPEVLAVVAAIVKNGGEAPGR